MPGARLASRLTETQRTKHNDVAFRKKDVTYENHRPTAANPCSPAGGRLRRTGCAGAAAGYAGPRSKRRQLTRRQRRMSRLRRWKPAPSRWKRCERHLQRHLRPANHPDRTDCTKANRRPKTIRPGPSSNSSTALSSPATWTATAWTMPWSSCWSAAAAPALHLRRGAAQPRRPAGRRRRGPDRGPHRVRSAAVKDGQVALDIITQGPGDVACCGMHKAHKTYALQDGRLVETTPAGGELVKVSAADLDGTSWTLLEIDGEEPALADAEVTLSFQDGQVSGSGGCNNYTGSFSLDEVNPFVMAIGPLAATQQACPDPAARRKPPTSPRWTGVKPVGIRVRPTGAVLSGRRRRAGPAAVRPAGCAGRRSGHARNR